MPNSQCIHWFIPFQKDKKYAEEQATALQELYTQFPRADRKYEIIDSFGNASKKLTLKDDCHLYVMGHYDPRATFVASRQSLTDSQCEKIEKGTLLGILKGRLQSGGTSKSAAFKLKFWNCNSGKDFDADDSNTFQYFIASSLAAEYKKLTAWAYTEYMILGGPRSGGKITSLHKSAIKIVTGPNGVDTPFGKVKHIENMGRAKDFKVQVYPRTPVKYDSD